MKATQDRARKYIISVTKTPKMTEGTHKLSYIQLKDKVKGHGAKFKGIYKFISMNNYNRYINLTQVSNIFAFLGVVM